MSSRHDSKKAPSENPKFVLISIRIINTANLNYPKRKTHKRPSAASPQDDRHRTEIWTFKFRIFPKI